MELLGVEETSKIIQSLPWGQGHLTLEGVELFHGVDSS